MASLDERDNPHGMVACVSCEGVDLASTETISFTSDKKFKLAFNYWSCNITNKYMFHAVDITEGISKIWHKLVIINYKLILLKTERNYET
jgi:hypothetical protein